MTDRIEKIREKAELVRQTKPLWRTMTASEAVFFRDGFAVALTYTDEDVVRAARAMHEKRSAHHWDDMSGWWRQDLIICARAALKSFGARRAE